MLLTACQEDDELILPPELSLKITAAEVAADGGQLDVAYELENPVLGETIRVDYTAEWIASCKIEPQTIHFEIVANPSEDARETEVRVAYGEHYGSDSFVLTQHGASSIVLSPREIAVSSEGGEQEVTYTAPTSSVKATATEEWIRDVVAQDGKITFVITKNETQEERHAKLIVEAEGVKNPGFLSIRQTSALAPELMLKKAKVEMPFTGGNAEIGYKVSHAIEGVDPVAECTEEWISELKAQDGVVTFAVAENPVKEARECHVKVSYKNALEAREILVKQAPAQFDDFVLETYDVLPSEFSVNIEAHSQTMPYLFFVMPTEEYQQVASAEALFEKDFTLIRQKAEYEGKTLVDYLDIIVARGNLKGGSFKQLTPDTDYTVYAYGLTYDSTTPDTATMATEVYTTTVRTAPKAESGVEFTFDVKVDGPEVAIDVVPSADYTGYYWAMILRDMGEEATADEIKVKLEDEWLFFYDLYISFGYTPERILQENAFTATHTLNEKLKPSTTYYVAAQCLDASGVPTQELSFQKFQTGEVKPSENVITLQVNQLKPYSAQLDITTTNSDPYTYTFAKTSEMAAYTTDQEKIDHLIQSRMLFEFTNDKSVQIPLEPSTDYEAYAFGFRDQNVTTKLITTPFRTPDPIVAQIEVRVNLGNYYDALEVAALSPGMWDYAPEGYVYMHLRAEMTPAAGNTCYWTVLDPSYIEGASDDDLTEFLLSNGTTKMELITEFEYDHQIQGIAVAVDADGNRSKPWRGEILTITREGKGNAQEFVDNAF